MGKDKKFTDLLWDKSLFVYEEIINHKFVKQLANGSLKKSCFAHYLSQDILYIKDDYTSLLELSKRSLKPSDKAFFELLAADGLKIEKELHDNFLSFFKVNKARKKSPAIEEYTSFLLAHVKNSDYHIAIAALLPCFWIYNMSGKHIIAHSIENNVYKKWVDTYSGCQYDNYTIKFINIVDSISEEVNSCEKEKMIQAYIKSAQYELAFFEESINI